MSTETTVQNLKINKLTKAQYDTITPSATEAYELTDLSSILDTIPDTTKLSYYGTCDTAASTRNKVVVCEGFALKTGISIRVKFTNSQNYSGSARLNVNNTGNITVQYISGAGSLRYCWRAGEIVSFTYDGTNWIMEDAGIASTSYYGYTQLNSSATSTSTSVALTPSALNDVMQNIVTDYPVYSATSAYAVGDKVRYSTNMYECNTAIAEGGEEWDATHWTQLPALTTQIDSKANNSDVIKKDGGSSQQTVSLSSGTGTTALGVKSRSTSSYISFNNSSGWIGSYGVSSDKKPVFYNGTGYTLAYTSDIPTIATSVSASSTNAQTVGAKLFYDTVGNIESALNTINSGS